MTIQRASLIDLAREAKATAEGMTTRQLDDWYETHVGYRPSVDSPDLAGTREHTATVAGMMFFHSCPEGLETPGAEAVESRLEFAINRGIEL